jgi:hypothetical protein
VALLADNSESSLKLDLDPSNAKAYLSKTPAPELVIYVKFSKPAATPTGLSGQSSPKTSHPSPSSRRSSEYVMLF